MGILFWRVILYCVIKLKMFIFYNIVILFVSINYIDIYIYKEIYVLMCIVVLLIIIKWWNYLNVY